MSKSASKVVPIRPKSKKPARAAQANPDLAAAEAAFLEAFERCRRAELENVEAECDDHNAREAKERAAKVVASVTKLRDALGPFSQVLPPTVQLSALAEDARLAALGVEDCFDATWTRQKKAWEAGRTASVAYAPVRASFLRAAAQAFGGVVPHEIGAEVAWRDEAVKKLMEDCQVHPWPGWAGKAPGL